MQFHGDGSSIRGKVGGQNRFFLDNVDSRSILIYGMLDKPIQNQGKNAISMEVKLDGDIIIYDSVVDNFM